jgi:threonine dehydrogenase-like Zn-dependent dehydrogenase
MWQLQQPAPSVFDRLEVPEPTEAELAPGDVLLRFLAGSICGSDIPKFLGNHDPDNPYTGLPGVPLHEFVGRVEASRANDLHVGQRVVGIISESRGLAELVINPASMVHAVDDRLSDIEATIVQPISTVLSAYSHTVDLTGKTVAVLGLGSLGLLFAHVAKSRGAARVIGVDRIERADVAQAFGIDECVRSDVRSWARSVSPAQAPDIIVEAIGHRQEHVSDAIEAVRPHGHLLVFGLPEDHYVIPMRTYFRKNLTMWAGFTTDWARFLPEAQTYLLNHRELTAAYITNTYSLDHAATAYSSYSTPTQGRLKIALTPPTASPASSFGANRR